MSDEEAYKKLTARWVVEITPNGQLVLVEGIERYCKLYVLFSDDSRRASYTFEDQFLLDYGDGEDQYINVYNHFTEDFYIAWITKKKP